MHQPASLQSRRDFYVIGHGCNDIPKIKKAFRQKVNGIECDLWADDDKKWWISHDGTERMEVAEWLSFIGEAEKKFRRELAVIVFDIKTPNSIVAIRELINQKLPAGLSHIYSTAKIDKAHIFNDIIPSLTKHEAIAIDEEDNPTEVADFFKKIGATQCCYGNGITLIPLNTEFHISMKQAAPIRDSTGPFSKIYTWSVHRKEALRKYIEEDKVDGIIVGLNNFFTKPVSNALRMIRDNKDLKLADRNTSLF